MTPYTYNGPQSAVTLKLADGTELEVPFVNGKEARLPGDHPFVRKLILKKRLTEVVAQPTPDPLPAAKKTSASEKEALNAG